MLRAGASDKDRDAWLAERLTGLTATQVRDLKVKGAAYRNELLAEKRSRSVTSIDDNKYLAWGRKREPIIAEWVFAEFGIANESRVFHAAAEGDLAWRFLASPDGVGVGPYGRLRVSEIKTSKHDIAPGTSHYDKAGYFYQMQWSMFVTGAVECLYVWEQHDDLWFDNGGEFFEPMPLGLEPRWEWIERDEQVIAELVDLATEFLAEVDSESDDDPAEDYRELLAKWAAADIREKKAAARKAEMADLIRQRIGDVPEFSLKVEGLPSISYYTPKPTARFDSAAFKAADPDTYQKYVKTASESKPVLRILAVKEES